MEMQPRSVWSAPQARRLKAPIPIAATSAAAGWAAPRLQQPCSENIMNEHLYSPTTEANS